MFLNIRNPKYDDKLHRIYTSDSRINSLQEERYDGIIGNDVKGRDIESKGKEYLVFNPNQIKSATDNIGTFSTTDNDIRHSSITEYTAKVASISTFTDRLPVPQQAKFAAMVSQGDVKISCM